VCAKVSHRAVQVLPATASAVDGEQTDGRPATERAAAPPAQVG
jgi:hypothetical protein